MDTGRRSNSFSGDKRGMSPLIATVLLIAFAVALGAMIINLSSKFGEQGPDCSGIRMVVDPYICYTENNIRLSVRNLGDEVESVTMRIVDDTGETTKTLPNSNIRKNALLKKDIPYLRTGRLDISLIPSIMYKDEETPCEEPALEMNNIPDC